MPLRSNDEKIIQRVYHRFHQTAADFQLIEEGDTILVAVSGGKDSLALLELMARRSKVLKPHFRVYAAHVVMTNIPYQTDVIYLRNYATSLGVELQVVETAFDASTDQRKSPCFLCSWNRRKALFETAKSLGCNKIALGHHMDDVLVTLLMNQTFQGAFGTMPPRLKMEKFDMTLIRPLCRIEEQDLQELARIRNFQRQVKCCPYEEDSHRSQMKKVLEELVRMNPEAKYNLWGSMTNVQVNLLPNKCN